MPNDPIEHVIVLMFENRSFDHLLAGCPKILARQPANGLNEYDGHPYPQAPGAARILTNDPSHETPDVLVQLQGSGSVAQNGGFVLDYLRHHPQAGDAAEVMRYHAVGSLPAIHALADTFTVCDNWYASVPGPTWTNRLFAMSGTSLGRVKMPGGLLNLNVHWYDQPTIFDRLNEKKLNWRVYFGDTPLSFLLVHQWQPQNVLRHHHMPQFFEDAAGEAAEFPAFALIEPAYLNPGANDAHPPHDIIEADVLVANVYNAIRANEALWNSSLLLILCDEHGGFYDHVPSPPAIAPDHHAEEYSFDRYGVRVPAILVSPHVANGILSTPLDHTSLLRYLQLKWGLGPLGARTDSAQTFGSALGVKALRTDTPDRFTTARPAALQSAPSLERLNEHQLAIVALSQHLESMTQEDPSVVAARAQHVLSGPQSQADAAVDRVEAFIAQQKSLAQQQV